MRKFSILILLFLSSAIAQEYYIDIKDITLDTMEITIERNGCRDVFTVSKEIKDIKAFSKELVKKLKKKHDKIN